MIKENNNKKILVIQPYDKELTPYTLCWIWAKDYTSVCYYYGSDADVYCRADKEEVEEIQKKYPPSSYYRN